MNYSWPREFRSMPHFFLEHFTLHIPAHPKRSNVQLTLGSSTMNINALLTGSYLCIRRRAYYPVRSVSKWRILPLTLYPHWLPWWYDSRQRGDIWGCHVCDAFYYWGRSSGKSQWLKLWFGCGCIYQVSFFIWCICIMISANLKSVRLFVACTVYS